jgi:hypothetical protein
VRHACAVLSQAADFLLPPGPNNSEAAINGQLVGCRGSELDDAPHEALGIFVNWLYMEQIKLESDCQWSIRCVLLW